MANLNVEFMGLKLRNPIIVGACTLSATVEGARELERAGAGAIVYKSLFEEQIQMERAQLDDEMDAYSERNAEMVSIFPTLEHAGPTAHIIKLIDVKKNISIPVIASLNCVYDVTWFDYAKQLEDAGVDALELNFYSMPTSMDKTAAEIEEEKVKIVQTLKKRLKIPFCIKLSPYYTNTMNFVSRLDKAGASSFALFNRLFQPEVNIDEECHMTRFNLSNRGDFKLALRYVGLLHNKIKGALCGTNGIYTHEDIIQMLLSGADVVQMVSAIYKNQPSYIAEVLAELENWMDTKGYKSINEFKGKLSANELKSSDIYYRAQYLDFLLKPEEIINKYPMR
ncbi:dihydroorotate dehydrogenase-like protein [Ancylomarina euxinus]|uniref:Dihydroorotate dehydrogenase-like protein n=1 Tax=Ancylomarina euxinus TaxID=2283627 RepID=A0A425Y6V3_9BACT|nr:dihydroorotate dehydrogenase-like protein [Ancylomarina euxinus]MCZ4694119.1 dihydroorotate dehydrogenase-like protein [Ancylomarina euxinus]MUP15784.1 dihydroorotate dehydrogenase-like protein [Ancylomarina euxinus]RRG24012.1 dihydroorotate dehydrogenase-like protein [Ancylomarina euxinus]